MKKICLLLIGGFALNVFVHAQTATRTIEINNVKAKITNSGPLFWDGTDAVFFVPKSGAKSTIFTSSPWIGGVHNGELHLMAETYKQNGRDLQQGPVDAPYTNSKLTYWDRIWSVSKSEIQTFRTTLQGGQTPDVNVFRDIYEWPAKGNVTAGDTTRSYAPFVDANNDQRYNPLDGDYPAIKGDQSMFTIMNDDIAVHQESSGKPLIVEIHRMVYGYTLPGALSNSLFVDYKVINRSAVTYDSLLFSSFVDFDLGRYDDDYVGTDTSRNMIYAFNGDPTDEGPMGYGSTPPAQACVILNHKLLSSMYYNNTFAPVTGNPSVSRDFYNYMQGKWKTGAQKHAGDSGFSSTDPVTVFSYGGDPCNNTGWWEGSATIQPGDRRILGTIEPTTLAPNQSLDVTLAFVYARAGSGDNIASVCSLKTAVDTVAAWYKTNNGGSTGINNLKASVSFAIYPNPASQNVIIEGVDLNGAVVSIFDIMGKKIKELSITHSESISISDLKPGMYFVTVSTENGTATKRLMVK